MFALTVNAWKADCGPPQPVTVYVILVEPAESAVTKPEVGFTEATEGLVLLQVPPASPDDEYVAV